MSDVDRLADRLRLAHIERTRAPITPLAWEDLQPSEQARWRDQAETAIAALDIGEMGPPPHPFDPSYAGSNVCVVCQRPEEDPIHV